MKKLFAVLCAVLTIACIGVPAEASIVHYSDRGSFEVQGTIIYNYGFEDYGPGGGTPPDPWTSHGVTYNTQDNLIIGPTFTVYSPISNVFMSNYWSPLPADIETAPKPYTMFGLDLGYVYSSDITMTIDFEVYTNLGTYLYEGLSVPRVNSSMDFYGFIAGPNEYFTGFKLTTASGGAGPGIDNVTLGITPVPIPGAIWLLGSGLIGVGSFRRKLKN